LYIHIYLVTTLIFILDNYILYKRQSVRNFLIHGEGYVLVYKFFATQKIRAAMLRNAALHT